MMTFGTSQGVILFLLGLCELVLAAMGAYAVIRLAACMELVDNPNHRSSHQTPTPKGGGVGILAALALGAIWLGTSPWFWLPSLLAGLLAFIGDRREIGPKLRLGFQFLLALTILLGTACLRAKGGNWLLVVWWCVFVVGTANIYNFMDGIDGLSALTGIVGFGLCSWYIGRFPELHPYAMVAMCLALACMGFLPFNFPRARVFMGDVGSILLGTVYGVLVALGSRSWLDFLCLASFLFTYYADAIITMALRMRRGDNLLEAHRSHLYQLLANEIGLPHWFVSILYAAGQLFVGLCVLWVQPVGALAVLGVLLVFSVVFIGLSLWVRALAGEMPERSPRA